MKMPRFARASLLMAMCLGTASTWAASFSGLYDFGDSLSDVGNVFLSTGGAVPATPYFQGRFSNGLNWVDDLSADLGLGAALPSLAGGNDYAFGGAVTGTSVPNTGRTVPDIVQQVGLFTQATGGVAPSTGLYTVWIGANDVFTAISDVGAGTLTFAQAQADLATAAQTAAGAVQALASEGAKTFLVPLVPDLGKTPNVTDFPPLIGVGTALAESYNAALEASVSGVAASAGLDVHFVDTFSLLDSAVADPEAYGFSDVTHRCYTGALTGGTTPCATPDTYLFWDGEHPTVTAHALIADAAFAAVVPEPSEWALMLVGMVGMVGVGVAARRSPRRAGAGSR